MDLSFQEKEQFVNPLHGLQVTTIFGIQENSGVFLPPCTSSVKTSSRTECSVKRWKSYQTIIPEMETGKGQPNFPQILNDI